MTTVDEQRVLQLGADGVPATWIAEDVGASYAPVQKRLKGAGLLEPDWVGVQVAIRRTPALAALHEEFSPRRSSRRRTTT